MVLKTLGQKVKALTGEDRGVSPVIGVILMVAITVILAAVIGAFVLGLGDNIDTNVQAGASINDNPDEGTLTVTYSSSQNADYLTATINGQQAYEGPDTSTPPETIYRPKGHADFDSESTTEIFKFETVGNSQTFDVTKFGVEAGNEYGIVVTAHNDAGSSTVIVDTTRQTNPSS